MMTKETYLQYFIIWFIFSRCDVLGLFLAQLLGVWVRRSIGFIVSESYNLVWSICGSFELYRWS